MIPDDVPHGSHDVKTYNEAFDTKIPQIHEDILWCSDCEEEFVVNRYGEVES